MPFLTKRPTCSLCTQPSVAQCITCAVLHRDSGGNRGGLSITHHPMALAVPWGRDAVCQEQKGLLGGINATMCKAACYTKRRYSLNPLISHCNGCCTKEHVPTEGGTKHRGLHKRESSHPVGALREDFMKEWHLRVLVFFLRTVRILGNWMVDWEQFLALSLSSCIPWTNYFYYSVWHRLNTWHVVVI